SRHALLNGLTPDDLVALRYGIAGTLLLPVFIRRGVADCAGIGWRRAIVLAIGVVLAGLAAIGVAGSRTGGPSIVVGDLLFLATGLLWGFYPLLLQKWNVGAMTSTAIVSVLSLVYIP